MSIPPQTIRIKRKRDESGAPVTFLQFDDGVKRHRTGSNWAYQRRDPNGATPPSPAASRNNVKPVIHVSKPENEPASPAQRQAALARTTPRKTLSPHPSLQRLRSGATEPRRFHLSRTSMAGHDTHPTASGISKKSRTGPAVFVERSRKQKTKQMLKDQGILAEGTTAEAALGEQATNESTSRSEPRRKFKKPGTTRAKSPRTDAPARAPLPQSATQPHSENMDKIAADMNQWVLNEIGANLQEMEQQKQKEKNRFLPKPPAKRYHERHPEESSMLQPHANADSPMTDVSDDDDGEEGDWVIEEYVRIPASAMVSGLSPSEVGVLVLDGEEDDMLFFGPEHDDDDDLLEDDEDENAENYYTADYPEEEVDSDDEYGRHAYYYRANNVSDDEEFDNNLYSENESDDMVMEGDNDDVTMARIKAYVRRSNNAY